MELTNRTAPRKSPSSSLQATRLARFLNGTSGIDWWAIKFTSDGTSSRSSASFTHLERFLLRPPLLGEGRQCRAKRNRHSQVEQLLSIAISCRMVVSFRAAEVLAPRGILFRILCVTHLGLTTSGKEMDGLVLVSAGSQPHASESSAFDSMSGLGNCVLVESACRPEPGQRLVTGPWVLIQPSRLTGMDL